MEHITNELVQGLLRAIGGITGLYLIRWLKRLSERQHGALAREMAKVAVLYVESVGAPENSTKLKTAEAWLAKKLPWAKPQDLSAFIEAALREAKGEQLAH